MFCCTGTPFQLVPAVCLYSTFHIYIRSEDERDIFFPEMAYSEAPPCWVYSLRFLLTDDVVTYEASWLELDFVFGA